MIKVQYLITPCNNYSLLYSNKIGTNYFTRINLILKKLKVGKKETLLFSC